MFDGGFYRAMAQYTEGMALPLSTLSAQWKLQVVERKIGPFVSGNSGRDQLEEKMEHIILCWLYALLSKIQAFV